MDADRTPAALVTERPAAARVFHRLGIDFWRSGRVSLAEACAAKGLAAEAVLAEIEVATADAGATELVRWDLRPIDELIGHLVAGYHEPLRGELARLAELAAHAEVQGSGFPEGLAALVAEVRRNLEVHLDKEEKILFPLILAGRGPTAHMPVQVILQEHEDHALDLERLRAITSGFRAPDGASASWQELVRGLARLDHELKDHTHLENNILFPRALAG